MKLIELSRGKSAMVDDEDYDYLLSFGAWYAGKDYPQRINKRVKPNKTLLMHRIVWERHNGPVPDGLMIDHKNGDGYNVTKDNLRLANPRQNVLNSKTRSHNKSGYKGVHIDPRRENKYQAMIRINGRLEHIGMFNSPEVAASAFNIVAAIVHGPYARFNNVPTSQEAIDVTEANQRLMNILYPKEVE